MFVLPPHPAFLRNPGGGASICRRYSLAQGSTQQSFAWVPQGSHVPTLTKQLQSSLAQISTLTERLATLDRQLNEERANGKRLADVNDSLQAELQKLQTKPPDKDVKPGAVPRYLVGLTSEASLIEAQEALADARSRCKESLGPPAQLSVKEVIVSGKTWYRVIVEPGRPLEAADRMCAKLKAACYPICTVYPE
jgi:hypothetical protein